MLAANEAAIAWAAGLFEGEGCITHVATSNNRPVLKFGMTDLDVVQRFNQTLGSPANILTETRRPKKDGHARKVYYTWSCAKKSEVVRILEMFLPYFGERRAYKALNALDWYDGIM